MARRPNRIVELRNAHGLSEDALADRLGWLKSKVHRLETGGTELNLRDMRQIAAALGIRPSELLNDEDVEYRAGESEEIVRSALSHVAPDDRELFVRICIDLARIVRRSAPKRDAVMLSGNTMYAMQLAELWNDFDDSARERALGFLRGIDALKGSAERAA